MMSLKIDCYNYLWPTYFELLQITFEINIYVLVNIYNIIRSCQYIKTFIPLVAMMTLLY